MFLTISINESLENYSNLQGKIEEQEKHFMELINNKYAFNNSSVGFEEMMSN
jgi:hypothetical protein